MVLPISSTIIPILVLPLIGFFILMIFGKTRAMQAWGDKLATVIMGIVWLLSVNALAESLNVKDPLWQALDSASWVYHGWISSPATHAGSLNQLVQSDSHFLISIGFSMDHLTAIMLFVVASVSFFVHMFSIGYMHGEIRYTRFFTILQIFTFGMLLVVLADNLLILYIGWEIMGFASYSLIGHYWEKESARFACLKAFMTTRVGDVLMFVGMMIIWAQVGSMRFEDINAAIATGQFTADWRFWAGILVFCGAIGKSAQFPLHVWLPDAMEGPTPVSALIHAATMVAAGVYLVARTILIPTPEGLMFIAYTGGFTALFAASIAVVQMDIKKVLAYSTISQLGYMMLGLGLAGVSTYGYSYGIYHLVTHAFFKACLFLGSGSIIHAMHHQQDMGHYGGLWKKLPITGWTFLIATLCLCGFPFSSGFYSKDGIIASAVEFGYLTDSSHILLPFFAVSAAMFTTFYMMRLIFLTFTGKPRDKHAYEHAHESPFTMTVPLVYLAIVAVLLGFPMVGGDWFKKRNPMPSLANYAMVTDTMKSDKVLDPDVAPTWVPKSASNTLAPRAVELAELPTDVETTVIPAPASSSVVVAQSVLSGHPGHEHREIPTAISGHPGHDHNVISISSGQPGHAEDEDPVTGGKLDAEHADDSHTGNHSHDDHSAGAHTSGKGDAHGKGAYGDDGHGKHGKGHDKHLYHVAHKIASIGSYLIVFGFITLAALFYFEKVRIFNPAKWKEANPRVHAMLQNKYYVDEFYIGTIIKPLMKLCDRVWKFDNDVIDGVVNATGRSGVMMSDSIGKFDKNVVDGAVNKLSDSVNAWGGIFARLQSGNIRHYLMGMTAGLSVLVMAFLFFPEELSLFAGDVSSAFQSSGGFLWDYLIGPLYSLIFAIGELFLFIFHFISFIFLAILDLFVTAGLGISTYFSYVKDLF
jgi:NADH-quinone oxidoreductase subunit L